MKIISLGLCHYEDAHKMQKELVETVRFRPNQETIILCNHHPVVTLGKKTVTTDLCGWKGQTYNVERGGRATYHGPGQVVAYPIIHLEKRNKDIYAYLRALEKAMELTLADYALNAKGDPDNTGVWIANKKIASIGVAIKRWVTYHGLAINLDLDPQAFKGINPCGFTTSKMTSVEELLGHKICRNEFESKLVLRLTEQLTSIISTDFPSAHV